MTTITRDDWLKALADCIVREDDTTALSYQELGELFGLHHTATHSKVRRLLEAGQYLYSAQREGQWKSCNLLICLWCVPRPRQADAGHL